jgi:hypothetical protein
MMLIRPTQMCWICGKAVTPETYQTDEHGSAVHARCHAVKNALANASAKLGRQTRLHASRRPAKPIVPFRVEEHPRAS